MFAPVDEAGDPLRRISYTYDKLGNLLTTTEPNGNLTADPDDFTTTNSYNEIYELTSVVNAEGDTMSYEYDSVGNVVTVVDPRKDATSDPTDFTTKYEYDLAHRPTKTIDALGLFTTTGYDRDGLAISQTDQLGNTTVTTLDERGMPVEIQVPHRDDGGTVTHRTTRYEYDEVGNQTRTVCPRGVATGGEPDDFATVAIYDPLNRVIESRSAFDPGDARYNTPDVTTYTYDRPKAGGRSEEAAEPGGTTAGTGRRTPHHPATGRPAQAAATAAAPPVAAPNPTATVEGCA